MARHQQRRGLRPALLALGAGAVAAAGVITAGATASTPTTVDQVQQRLSSAQQRAGQLASTITSSSQQVGDLHAGIAGLQGQVTTLQGSLNARRTALLRVRDRLDAAEIKLGGLEKAKRSAERVLSEQLVGAYEGGHPDIISVVLESNGFEDLLERLNFAQRIGRQDARIVARVRSARRAVANEARTLGRLTARAQRVADSVLAERNRVARYRLKLVASELSAAKAKAAATGQLASAQQEVDALTQQLDRLQSQRPAVAGSGGAKKTSQDGAIPFPIATGEAAPPATWLVGEGIAIAAPAGTPELALCTGTVVLHGIGGMGRSAPVLRCAQPIDGHRYIFYGFVSPKHLAAIGANIAQGRPLARVGDGSIGTSSGPHLDIGFADTSGAPLGGAAAQQMRALLRTAYAS